MTIKNLLVVLLMALFSMNAMAASTLTVKDKAAVNAMKSAFRNAGAKILEGKVKVSNIYCSTSIVHPPVKPNSSCSLKDKNNKNAELSVEDTKARVIMDELERAGVRHANVDRHYVVNANSVDCLGNGKSFVCKISVTD